MYNNIKYRLTCICFLIACFSFVAQAQQSASNTNKISPEERERLEKQFKGSNFRVNDDGTIDAFHDTPAPTVTKPQPETKKEPAKEQPSDLNFLNVKEEPKKETEPVVKENPLLKDNNITVIKKEPVAEPKQNTEKDTATDLIDTILEKNNISSDPKKEEPATIKESPVQQYNSSIIIKKEKKDPVLPSQKKETAPVQNREEAIENTLPPKSEEHVIEMSEKNSETPPVKEAQVAVEKKENKQQKKADNKTTAEKKENKTTKKPTSRKKEPPMFDTLDESIDATQAMMEQIKKKYSTKLENRYKYEDVTIPQKKEGDGDINFLENPQNDTSQEDLYKKFGDEPSYFLNDVLVTKEEAESISPRDIISREVKTRNTTTGNPNGEIWIKTKASSK